MANSELSPSLTIGIEEEYLLVDPESRNLADQPQALFDACEACMGNQVTSEFLRSQIEIATPVCANISEAERELKRLRSEVSRVAQDFGLRIIAASTHPFANWEKQKHTPKERYDALARDMGGAIRRMLICGMHVHAGIENPDLRIDLMNQVSYFLPHLLALSSSSPFWQGQDMGMMSSRLTVFDGMPRTGIPDRFESYADYERLIDRMVASGALEDASKIWWDVRPSSRYPTLEMRITDVCTRVDDALTIAALYQSLLRFLVRLRRRNLRWRVYPRTLIHENRWLAQRHGVEGQLVDLGRERRSNYSQLAAEILELVREDAEALDCIEEVENMRQIVEHGSSAQRQRSVFYSAREGGADEREALSAVVDFLIEETVAGLD
ncbi:MAG: carboxylate-amine ligase [Halieaceae bacterium]|jgi:carboxylate-amine ligase|nr:carboxylate-amine ligase [Halieaceae bacterium]